MPFFLQLHPVNENDQSNNGYPFFVLVHTMRFSRHLYNLKQESLSL